jgi:hypothetical protein
VQCSAVQCSAVQCSAVIKAGYGRAEQSKSGWRGQCSNFASYLGSLSALLTTDEDEVAHPGPFLLYLKQRIRAKPIALLNLDSPNPRPQPTSTARHHPDSRPRLYDSRPCPYGSSPLPHCSSPTLCSSPSWGVILTG